MTKIGNGAVELRFGEEGLEAVNRLAGTTWAMAWPAFAMRIGGRMVRGEEFARRELRAGPGEVTAVLEHEGNGLRAEVRYWVEGEEPWFRKQVGLEGPEGTPTPERLWVDEQQAEGPMRRVGYGVRGGREREEIKGADSYAQAPACGYPVWVGDWFVGLEHPTGFAVTSGEGARWLELYQHPTWDENWRIESFPAVYGVAGRHEAVAGAFMAYLEKVRNPRLERPLTVVTLGWSTRYVGDGEYVDSFEGREAFVRAMLDIGLRPRAVGIDAGWFERRSMYHAKGDDEGDGRLIAFRERLQAEGMELAVWVSHNGPVGFEMEWIREQGWETGQGPGAAYSDVDYVVMMQPSFEEALARRWERLVGEVGAVHLKMDWDNECATNERFAEQYPTVDHVREASVKAMNRVDARLRALRPALKTRHGWWPSPWWLKHADHVWLADSGDCEYDAWPARSARDRDATERDQMYYHITRTAETPLPLDAFDNHGFAQALCNCFHDERDTWLNTCVLSALRGTTYIHYPVTPEGLRDWQARKLQQVLEWWDGHAHELGQPGARMVLGRPSYGEVYGYLHPHDTGAWLMLRNPSVEPQRVDLGLSEWLGYEAGMVRQVYPHWRQTEGEVWLLGHEVKVLEVRREAEAGHAAGLPAEFMVAGGPSGWRYSFPTSQQPERAEAVRVHPDMRLDELWVEQVSDETTESVRRLQWFIGVPHRMEKAEVLVTLRGAGAVLDGIGVVAGTSRYRGDVMRDHVPLTRIRRGQRGYGTGRVLPPLGPRERDDYVFAVPDGGYTGVTVELHGAGVEESSIEAWLSGYEAPARWQLAEEEMGRVTAGPVLPGHPYGFGRWVRLA